MAFFMGVTPSLRKRKIVIVKKSSMEHNDSVTDARALNHEQVDAEQGAYVMHLQGAWQPVASEYSPILTIERAPRYDLSNGDDVGQCP